MYARARATEKTQICLHSALYDYNTLIIKYLRVYTLSARHLHYLHSAKNRLNKVQTPISSSKHPEGNEGKR